MDQWTPSAATMDDYGCFNYIGTLETDSGGIPFEVLRAPDRLIFGGCCNVGFLESGYMLIEEYETEAEALQELSAELDTYYRDGRDYVTRIVCNDRM